MFFLSLELENLIKNPDNKKLLNPIIDVLECDLVSPENDKWRLSVLKQVKESGEQKLYERLEPLIGEMLYSQ